MATTVDRILNEDQAAEFLGVKPQTLSVWRCTKRVQIPYVKIGRSVKYRMSALEAYLEANTVAGEAE